MVLNLFCILSYSQTIKLDYEPKGGVIKFYFNNLICYTDTTSLFSKYKTDTTYVFEEFLHREVEKLIRKNLENDTVVFTKNFVSIDIFPGEHPDYWQVWDDLRILTRTNKVLIFDSYGNRVQKVQIKQKGRIKDCGGGRYFVSKETKEVLFLYEKKGNQIVCLGEVSTY